MHACSRGLLTRRRASIRPEMSSHSTPSSAAAERFGQTVRQARRPLLDADAPRTLRVLADRLDHGRGSSANAILRPRGVAQQAHHHVGRRLVVRVALERGMADLVGDRHPLHLPRHQHHLAVLRHDQHVRHEVAPVIQAGEIKNVLGRRDQAEIEVARRHFFAHGVEAGAILLLVEGGHHAVAAVIPAPRSCCRGGSRGAASRTRGSPAGRCGAGGNRSGRGRGRGRPRRR